LSPFRNACALLFVAFAIVSTAIPVPESVDVRTLVLDDAGVTVIGPHANLFAVHIASLPAEPGFGLIVEL
jgi:hypothetical protein